MKFALIAFKSKNELLLFSKILKANGVSHNITNTPRSISVSCGLSIKLDFHQLQYISSFINSKRNSIMGVYMIERNNFNERIQKII